MNLYGYVYNIPIGWFDDLGNEPRQQRDEKAKDANRALNKINHLMNLKRKANGLPPIQTFKKLGDKMSKGGDAARWLGLALMAYANGAFAECVCECKDKKRDGE